MHVGANNYDLPDAGYNILAAEPTLYLLLLLIALIARAPTIPKL